MIEPLKVGLIGCGRISDIYIQNCQSFAEIDLLACASLDLAESQAKAAAYNIPKATLPQEIINDPDIEAVLNLTIPAAHAEISLAALDAGV